jgi:hypothetical protein
MKNAYHTIRPSAHGDGMLGKEEWVISQRFSASDIPFQTFLGRFAAASCGKSSSIGFYG